MNYPKRIKVGEVELELDTDFRTALRCFEVIEDESIDDTERALAVIYLLLGDVPFHINLQEVMNVLLKYLRCGKENDRTSSSEQKKDMDLFQDEKYIVASFMSEYHIDLSADTYMHWWHFMNLLNGLTGECVLNKVREIRNTDLNDYKGKARERLARAKRQVALKEKMSQEDEEALAKFDAMFNVSHENILDEGDSLIDEEG